MEKNNHQLYSLFLLLLYYNLRHSHYFMSTPNIPASPQFSLETS